VANQVANSQRLARQAAQDSVSPVPPPPPYCCPYPCPYCTLPREVPLRAPRAPANPTGPRNANDAAAGLPHAKTQSCAQKKARDGPAPPRPADPRQGAGEARRRGARPAWVIRCVRPRREPAAPRAPGARSCAPASRLRARPCMIRWTRTASCIALCAQLPRIDGAGS